MGDGFVQCKVLHHAVNVMFLVLISLVECDPWFFVSLPWVFCCVFFKGRSNLVDILLYIFTRQIKS